MVNDLALLMHRFEEANIQMGKVLQHCAEQEAGMSNLSLSEIHFLAAVAEAEPINGTALTKALGLTKGGVSKMASRLLQKGMIKSEKDSANKKNQYYVLTRDGVTVCNIHKRLHDSAKGCIIHSIEKYDENELELFRTILHSISNAIDESSEDVLPNIS